MWAVVFYSLNAVIHFTFMDQVMTPVSIALFKYRIPFGDCVYSVPVYQ